jgi:hypothetical protein
MNIIPERPFLPVPNILWPSSELEGRRAERQSLHGKRSLDHSMQTRSDASKVRNHDCSFMFVKS